MKGGENIAVVILAAGESKRLGRAKQLVVWEGKTLLRRAAETASASSCEHVFCVLGAKEEECRVELEGTRAQPIVNADYARGIGTSIRAAVAACEAANAQAMLVMLCDQPNVTSATLDRLVADYDPHEHAGAASSYAGSIGVPALFASALFSELKTIGDDEGAKRVLKRHEAHLALVEAPEANADVDTSEDLAHLNQTSAPPRLRG
jgi:molybdenum cofactor cytidylyltransferase